jgi:hypothetical protein
MTARSTYQAAVASACQAQQVTLAAAETVRQETINVSGCNVGYNTINGNYANFAAAVKAANLAKFASIVAAEQAKQAALMVARDALRASGDLGPV